MLSESASLADEIIANDALTLFGTSYNLANLCIKPLSAKYYLSPNKISECVLRCFTRIILPMLFATSKNKLICCQMIYNSKKYILSRTLTCKSPNGVIV